MRVWYEHKVQVSKLLPLKLRPILFHKKFELVIFVYLGVAVLLLAVIATMFKIV